MPSGTLCAEMGLYLGGAEALRTAMTVTSSKNYESYDVERLDMKHCTLVKFESCGCLKSSNSLWWRSARPKGTSWISPKHQESLIYPHGRIPKPVWKNSYTPNCWIAMFNLYSNYAKCDKRGTDHFSHPWIHRARSSKTTPSTARSSGEAMQPGIRWLKDGWTTVKMYW